MYKPEYYIVFDIERNFRPYQSDIPAEIVDIGAIKIEARTMNVAASFSSLVKPKSSLSRHTTKLTGITKQDIKEAERFPQAIERFREFVGENYMLVTWGKEDYSFLKEDCALHGVECPNLEKDKRFDLQKFVFHAYEELFPNQPSLKLAVEKLALQWEGEQHRAFDDAKNTVSIFLKVAMEKDLYGSYRRQSESLLLEEGVLTDKGRKRLTRWVFKELKRGQHSSLTWGAFIKSRTWENALDQHDFDDNALHQLQGYFKTALRKAKQQLHALSALKKQNDGMDQKPM